MTQTRYKISRIGFVNFYGYRNQVFEINDGLAAFLGNNGSGKSVTTLAVLPNILTMNDKQSLNVGSNDGKNRVIKNYFEYHKDVAPDIGHTSYVWVEFGKNDEQFKTLIIGYRHTQNNTVKVGFVGKNDTFRLNPEKDFVSDDKQSAIEIGQFKKKFSQHFSSFDSQSSYKEAVNHYIYGFSNQEKYDDMIKKMIAGANSTTKNKEFSNGLDESIAILNDALPSIEDHPDFDEASRAIITVIADRKKNETELKNLNKDLNALSRVESRIAKINNTIYHTDILDKQNKARGYYHKAQQKQQKVETEIAGISKDIAENTEKQQQLESQNAELQTKHTELQIKLDKYYNSDKQKDLLSVITDLEREQSNYDTLFPRIKTTQKNIQRLKLDIRTLERSIEKLSSQKDQQFKALESIPSYDDFQKDKGFKNVLQLANTGYKKLETLDNKNKDNLTRKNDLIVLRTSKEDEQSRQQEALDAEKETLQQTLTSWLSIISNEMERLEMEPSVDCTPDINHLTNDNTHYKMLTSQIQEHYSNIRASLQVEKKENQSLKIELENRLKTLENTEKTVLYTSKTYKQDAVNLYECIKFKPNIDISIKNAIEAALYYDKGLFTIVSKTTPEEIIDGQMITSPPATQGNDLFQYLEMEDDASAYQDAIYQTLSPYHIDTAYKQVYRDNLLIKPEVQPEKYIGITERETERLEMIAQTKADIARCQTTDDKLNNDIQKCGDKIAAWDMRASKCPTPLRYDNIQNTITAINKSIALYNSELQTIEGHLSNYTSERAKLITDYFEFRYKDILDPNDISTYYQTRDDYSEYTSVQNTIQELEKNIDSNNHNIQLKTEELAEKSDNLLSDKNFLDRLSSRIKDLTAQQTGLESAINDTCFNPQHALSQLSDYTNQIAALDKDIQKLVITIAKDEGKGSTQKIELPDLISDTESKKSRLDEISDKIKVLNHPQNQDKNTLDMYQSTKNITDYINEIRRDITISTLMIRNYDIRIEQSSDIDTLNYLTLTFIDNASQETRTHEEILTSLQNQIESLELTALNISNTVVDVFQTSDLKHVIQSTMAQAKVNAQNIIDIQESVERDDNISYYVDWKRRNNQSGIDHSNLMSVQKASAFINMIESKNTDEEQIKKIFDQIDNAITIAVSKDEIPSDFEDDLDNNIMAIQDIIKDIFNYKKWFQFELYERQNGQSDRALLTKKTFSTNSNGQNGRLRFEMILSSIESDKTVMGHSDAPIMMVMEEAFSTIDKSIRSYLIKRIHQSGISLVFNAPSFALPQIPDYKLTLNTFALEPVTRGEKDITLDVFASKQKTKKEGILNRTFPQTS